MVTVNNSYYNSSLSLFVFFLKRHFLCIVVLIVIKFDKEIFWDVIVGDVHGALQYGWFINACNV